MGPLAGAGRTHPPCPKEAKELSVYQGPGANSSPPTTCGKGHGCQSRRISTRRCIEGVICRNEVALGLQGLVNICLFTAGGTHEREFGFCIHFFLSL